MTLTDWELWAIAQKMVEMGPAGDRHVVERIAALTLADDAEGVDAWMAISARIGQLRDFKGAHGRKPH